MSLSTIFDELNTAINTSIYEASNKSSSTNNKIYKHTAWWDEILLQLNSEIKSLRNKIKIEPNREIQLKLELDLKKLDNDFRVRKRMNINKLKYNELINLDKCCRLNRKAFWSLIKRKQHKNVLITLTIDEIKTEFEKQFNEKLNTDPNDDSENIIKRLLETNKNTIYNHKIKLVDIESIVKNLPNGKAPGTSGVPNESFKYYKGVYE